MGKVYLPHAEQFDLMNENLSKLITAISTNIDITTWSGIQKVVRSGLAEEVFPVGTLLGAQHSKYGQLWFEVVAHNHYKSTASNALNTMTLMCATALGNVQYDAPEAFYVFEEDKRYSGAYVYFTIPTTIGSWTEGRYLLKLTGDFPKGGQLVLKGSTDASIIGNTVVCYESCTSKTTVGTIEVSQGGGSQDFGTFGVELNDINRSLYGSNNYKESAIRQFLNSTAVAGSVWTPQTKFDRPPSWAATLDGFAGGFDEEFLSAVGKVFVPCAANNTYESPDSTTPKGEKYTLIDKFYLASQQEIFGTTTDIIADDSVQLPYYEGATNVDRIKYRNGSAVYWRLRSPVSNLAGSARIVGLNGGVNLSYASHDNDFVPVCTIV